MVAALGLVLAAMLVGTLSANRQDARESPADAFAFLQPAISIDQDDREALGRGGIIAKTLEADARSHLVVFAASRLRTTPGRFIDGMRDITRIWRGEHVPRTGLVSEPIDAGDVAAISLTDTDLRAAQRCKPGDCAIKLSDGEIARIRRAAQEDGSEWQPRTQDAFRSVLLERLQSYRRGGLSHLDPFHDHDEPVEPQAVFGRLVVGASILGKLAPEPLTYLERYPGAPLPTGAEDRLYWLETVQSPKPTLQAVHQVIQQRPLESVAGASVIEVVVLTRQIFATHYVNGSIALTLLVRAGDGQRYMLHINRIAADGLGGWLSGVRRYFVERRVRSAARAAFSELKRNIELTAAASVVFVEDLRSCHLPDRRPVREA
jgi:hypothetical protein